MDASNNNDFVHQTGLPLEEVAVRYTSWANEYEKDLCEENYRGPAIVAGHMQELFPDVSSREQLRVVDAAAGTGFVADKLLPMGFENIDALEPSEGMMDILKAKNIYKNTFLEFLSDHTLPIATDSYDVAVIAGGMGEGHIPCKGLTELPRIVKPGGLVIIAMREAYLEIVAEYKGRLEPFMSQLESEGKWKMVSRTVVPRYSFSNNGILYTFRIC